MTTSADECRPPDGAETWDERVAHAGAGDAAGWALRRWQVSFRSGPGWYPVGEFVALTAAAAVERAVEVFGPGAGHRAEEIPWDAAPLPRLTPRPTRGPR